MGKLTVDTITLFLLFLPLSFSLPSLSLPLSVSLSLPISLYFTLFLSLSLDHAVYFFSLSLLFALAHSVAHSLFPSIVLWLTDFLSIQKLDRIVQVLTHVSGYWWLW